MRNSFQLPDYLPDQLPRNVLIEATNVLPAQGGFRPVKAFQPISDALDAKFLGGASYIASDGSAYLLAGTATGLKRYSSGTWLTLLSSMTVNDRWKFTQFGDYAIAVNGGATQVVNLTASTAAALAGAPTGTSVAVVGPHVVIGEAGGNKLLVQWSAFNDHTGWTPAVNQSGFQPMLDGGEVMGLAGGEYGIILQRFALTRMSLSGDSTAPFNFQQITSNVGCASKASVAIAGRTIFWYSDRGFFALDDGTSLRAIGNEKFDQSFRDAVSGSDFESIWSAVDPKRSLVFWGTPGTPGRVWVYNFALDKVTTLLLPFNGFFSGYESSIDLEGVAALYPDLDTMPYSLDDPRFQGGDPRLYFVNENNQLGALSGDNLAAVLTTGWLNPANNKIARVRSVWPITDATGGIEVRIDHRQRMGNPPDPQTSGMMQASGRVPLRCRGQYLSVSLRFAAGDEWSYVQGFDLDYEAGGYR